MDIPDEWAEDADERDISITEYLKRMTRAGRRQFGYKYELIELPAEPKALKLGETTRSKIEAQLKAWILANLSTDNAQDLEDLMESLEKDLSTLADELCDEGKAKYRRSQGGYLKLTNDE